MSEKKLTEFEKDMCAVFAKHCPVFKSDIEKSYFVLRSFDLVWLALRLSARMGICLGTMSDILLILDKRKGEK